MLYPRVLAVLMNSLPFCELMDVNGLEFLCIWTRWNALGKKKRENGVGEFLSHFLVLFINLKRVLLIICIKKVVKRIIHRAMQALWAIQTVVLHCSLLKKKKSQAIISCVRTIRGWTFGLHAIGVVLCLSDSSQGVWSPADTYRIAGCGLSKRRAYNMFSARANGKKVTFNNETGADAF